MDLMKNIKGDAMYEVINTFSYYGKLTKEVTLGSITYSKNSRQWFTATEEADGIIKTNSDRLDNYGKTYYNDDCALLGSYDRPFILRGGYWEREKEAGLFAIFASIGDGGYIVRFSTSISIVVLKAYTSLFF